MQIQRVQQNTNFNSLGKFARDGLQVALSTGRYGSSYGVEKLIQQIERNSPYHIVSVDVASYDQPILRAIHNRKEASDIFVYPGDGLFNKTLRSSLRKLNRKLKKETARIDKILDEQDLEAKSKPMFIPQLQKNQTQEQIQTAKTSLKPKDDESNITWGEAARITKRSLHKFAERMKKFFNGENSKPREPKSILEDFDISNLPVMKPVVTSGKPPIKLPEIAKKAEIAEQALSEGRLMQGEPPITDLLKKPLKIN